MTSHKHLQNFHAAKSTLIGLKLPPSVQCLLTFFEQCILGSKQSKHVNKQLDQCLRAAYSSKDMSEKCDHYARCAAFISKYILNICNQHSQKQHSSQRILNLEVQIKNESKLLLTKWEAKNVRINQATSQMIITNKNRQSVLIDLTKYYVRESHDTSRHALVLERIQNGQPHILRIAFKPQLFVEVKDVVDKLIWQAECQRLQNQLKESRGIFSNISKDGKQSQISKTYLNAQIINQHQKLAQTLTMPTYFNQEHVVAKDSYRKIYKRQDELYMQELMMLSHTQIWQAILTVPAMQWNLQIKEQQVVEKVLNLNTNLQLIYEKYSIHSKTYDRMVLKGAVNNHKILLYTLPQYFECHKLPVRYTLIQVVELAENESKIKIWMKLDHEQDYEHICQVLKSYSRIAHCKEIPVFRIQGSESVEQQQFYTIVNENIAGEEESLSGSIEDFRQATHQQQSRHIYKTYTLVPTHKTNHILQKHYLFQDWKRLDSGGVICVNEALINQQKKVIKYIMSTIGKTILKSKNPLNISLPVGIFKKQTHLVTIARNLSFAPILLEKASKATPTERIKLIVLFTLTIATLGIHMQKPFNPLLGQTFQGRIDGCPVYLEQISHHPPVSSYYLQGRGYKLYGSVGSKIELGMNSIKGFSDKDNFIEFDNGDLIYFDTPKLLISGILFGDRSFNFEDRNIVYDKTNHIYAQVNIGNDQAYFARKQNSIDTVKGYIWKVKPQFYSELKQDRKLRPRKQTILQEICQIQGNWTRNINFNKVQYFDFRTQLPFQLQYEQNPLESDSMRRLDVLKLIDNDLLASQTEKQHIEEQERRYRKLREKKIK